MKKIIAVVTALTFAFSVFAFARVASAAQPNNQACLGEDFSGYAKAFRPFGQVLSHFAVGGTPIIQGGLGDEIQNHLAGNVPDGILPNSCND